MANKFSATTDKENKFKAESSIISCQWLSEAVCAESKAKLQVVTYAVGEGAQIEITVYSDKDKKLGKLKDKVSGNRFDGEVDITGKIEERGQAYFEANLSKHGLKMESAMIPLLPKVLAKKFYWDKKEIHRGEEAKLTAEFDSGVMNWDDAIVIIYENNPDGHHERVTTFTAEVKNNKIECVWQFDYHEDTRQIPTEAEMNKYNKHYNPPAYFFVVLIHGVRIGVNKESGLLMFKDTVELTLISEPNMPIQNAKYTLTFPDGTQRKGQLDENGRAKIENVPPGISKVVYEDFEGPLYIVEGDTTTYAE